jgi:ubiquinone/menaquinone biosynthesis C-methylase UbiE
MQVHFGGAYMATNGARDCEIAQAPVAVQDGRFAGIQKHELEWWTNYNYMPWGEWTQYHSKLHMHLRPFRSVADVGSGPVPFFLSGVIFYEDAIAIDPLISKYLSIERYKQYHDKEFGCFSRIEDVCEKMFDGVFCLNTIDHVRDPTAFISELDRILEPGGRLYVCVDVEKPPDPLHPHMIHADWLDEQFSFYTYKTLLRQVVPSFKFQNDLYWFVGDKEE